MTNMTRFSLRFNGTTEENLTYNKAIYTIVEIVKSDEDLFQEALAEYLDDTEYYFGACQRHAVENQFETHKARAISDFEEYLFRRLDDLASPLYEDDARYVDIKDMGIIKRID